MSEKKPKPTAMAYLVISSQVFPLPKEVTTLGRKLDNDVVINNEMVSRNHAEIRRTAEGYFLVDLDSTSGTFLNQKQVTKSQLFSGDIILLANMPMMFVDQSAHMSEESEKDTGQLDD